MHVSSFPDAQVDADIRTQRSQAVAQLITLTKSCAPARDGSEPHPADLPRVAQALARLARRIDLFPASHFPLDFSRVNAFYRVAEDPDGGYALFVSASVPGRKQAPHDHTTWAAIAGVHGLERNVVYRRTPGDAPGQERLTPVRTADIGPGDVITLGIEDVHTTEIVGETPALHLHFYGLTQERMFRRVRFDSLAGGTPTLVPVPTHIRHPVIDAPTLHARLRRPDELAVLDVRDEGLYAQGHLLAAACAPLDRLGVQVDTILPRAHVPIVVVDACEDLAHHAAAILIRLGYLDVSVLRGGTQAWADAGYEVFQGVHVLGKALAEQAQITHGIPDITVAQLQTWQREGRSVLLLDVRPEDEYCRYTLPGSVNCPLADLPTRVAALALAPERAIVVHCAGRARSLIGAQTLIATGIPNPVFALRNGTMDWELAGATLARDGHALLAMPAQPPGAIAMARAAQVTDRAGVVRLDRDGLRALLEERDQRSLYLLDIRTPREFQAGHLPGWGNAPGGQLLHSMDSYLAVRGARVVLADWDGVRAPYVAAWLAAVAPASGFELFLYPPATDAALQTGSGPRCLRFLSETRAPWLLAQELSQALADGATLYDIDSSQAYRDWHIDGARFATSRWIARWLAETPPSGLVVLTSADGVLAQSVAAELRRRTGRDIRALLGGNAAWRAQGLPAASGDDGILTQDDRWQGPHALREPEARRQAFAVYLDWEAGLLAQLQRDGTELHLDRTPAHPDPDSIATRLR